MSLGSVTGSYSISQQYTPITAPGVLAPVGSDGTQGPGGAQRKQDNGPDGGFGQEVVLALQQSGLNLSVAADNGNTGVGNGDASPQNIAIGALSGSTGSNLQQALHTFVHAVYQAVQAEGLSSSTSGSGQGPAAGGYGDFQSNLQKLLQDVSNGTQNNATASLSSAFKDLQQSLGSGSGTGASQQASLHTFLQNLIALQNSQTLSSGGVGSLLSTSA
ncbi:hypothetical protein [Chromobacterium sphagni]|uniref:Uncharacterized protein n=1 Tax=Chromobacterium sphagni TaxID=1903179 RepID=A0A1S1X145_9NEIS|nr:hypothetical protein [Chromobacterium sphagni]OHX13257.1 hypothetical protein BI347_06870 [Chromobacterium sphagni]OHX16967.1 hypothetical protein BI344_11910 [Chromobacterium sphagni]